MIYKIPYMGERNMKHTLLQLIIGVYSLSNNTLEQEISNASDILGRAENQNPHTENSSVR
jgi:hypothetical protein